MNLSSNPSMADLLNQLRGAKVNVQLGTEKINATVLGVEKKSKPAGDGKGTYETWTLNLFAGGVQREPAERHPVLPADEPADPSDRQIVRH